MKKPLQQTTLDKLQNGYTLLVDSQDMREVLKDSTVGPAVKRHGWSIRSVSGVVVKYQDDPDNHIAEVWVTGAIKPFVVSAEYEQIYADKVKRMEDDWELDNIIYLIGYNDSLIMAAKILGVSEKRVTNFLQHHNMTAVDAKAKYRENLNKATGKTTTDTNGKRGLLRHYIGYTKHRSMNGHK